MKTVLIIVAILICLLWGGWLIAVPSELIVNEVESRMVVREFKGKLEGFKKGWFYNFKTEALDIYRVEDVVISVIDISGNLDFKSFLSLGAAVDVQGTLAGGELQSRLRVAQEGSSVDFTLSGAQLEQTGMYDLTGYRGKGELSADGVLNNREGEVRFQVKEASFAPVEVMGMMFPVDMVKTVRGIVKFRGNNVDIPSVAFEGKGFHARVYGKIENEIADMTAELMVSDSAIPDILLSSVLGRYKKGKGHYIVPIRTRVSLNSLSSGRK